MFRFASLKMFFENKRARLVSVLNSTWFVSFHIENLRHQTPQTPQTPEQNTTDGSKAATENPGKIKTDKG